MLTGGDQAKDFIDVYYLLKNMSLEKMFEYYKKKYNQKEINSIKRSLVYFDDVTESNWKSVKLLGEKISAKDIKQKIIEEMNRYNEKLIGNTSNGT